MHSKIAGDDGADKSKLRLFHLNKKFYFWDELKEIHLWDIFIVEAHFSGAFLNGRLLLLNETVWGEIVS